MGIGSEKILNRINSSARRLMISGMVVFLIPLFLLLVMILFAPNNVDKTLIIFCASFMVVGGCMFFFNVRICISPSKSSILKKNPEVLAMADELLENKIYADNTLIYSPRLVANAMDLSQISFTDEVFLIYVYIHRTNGVIDTKQLVLENAWNSIRLNIIVRKDPEINELINNIVSHCRYARVGYNDAGRAYLKQMRELWKQDQERKKNQPYEQ